MSQPKAKQAKRRTMSFRQEFGVSEETAKAASVLAKCDPSNIIGYREYPNRHVVVVHDDEKGAVKVEVSK